MKVFTVQDRKKSNRPYRTTEKLRYEKELFKFKQEVYNGEWGRIAPVSRNGKALKHKR